MLNLGHLQDITFLYGFLIDLEELIVYPQSFHHSPLPSELSPSLDFVLLPSSSETLPVRKQK